MLDKDGNSTNDTPNDTNDKSNDTNDAARMADFKSQLNRYENDAIRLAETLHTRVYNLRQRAQDAESKIPTDTQAVISAEDRDLLAVYKKLGTPKELGERGTKLVQLEKYRMVSDAAQVAGMNPNVLSKLLPGEAQLEVGEATGEDGKAKRIVRVVEEGKDPMEIGKYASANWTDFLPALQNEAAEGSGKAWIPQSSTASSDTGNAVHPLLKKKLESTRKKSVVEQPII